MEHIKAASTAMSTSAENQIYEKLIRDHIEHLSKVESLSAALINHIDANERSFALVGKQFDSAEKKLDDLLIATTRLATINEVAKEAGAASGRKAALIWTTGIAFLVVLFERVIGRLF